jgi:hypothetical protein
MISRDLSLSRLLPRLFSFAFFLFSGETGWRAGGRGEAALVDRVIVDHFKEEKDPD